MDAIELLLGRDSALRLTEPAPDSGQLETILTAAVRAPDHGRIRPWRFVVIHGEAIDRFGELMAQSLQRKNPAAPAEDLQRERMKARRAPLIVAVAARVQVGHKIPEIEQLMAVGAATQNMMLAAHALGFGAMWKTGGPAYDPAVATGLGLEASDKILGFIYLGTRTGGSSPIPRAETAGVVEVWRG